MTNETLASTITLSMESETGTKTLHFSAWLKNDERDPTNTKYMGLVRNITDEINTSISVTPIVTYDAENSFAYDTRATEKFNISFFRKNPVGDNLPNDLSEDDREWSNRVWITELVKFINRWQFRTDGNIVVYNPTDPEYQLYLARRVYIDSLTYTYSSSSPELVTGSMELQVGSSKGTANVEEESPNTLNDRCPTTDMDNITIYVSSSDGLVEYSMYYNGGNSFNDVRNCIISYSVKEGPEQPFGYIQMKLSKKRLSVIAPNLIGDLIAGKNRIEINAMGKGEYIITKCKTNDDVYILTGYSIYEIYRQIVLPYRLTFKNNSVSPFKIITTILSSSWDTNGITQSPIYILEKDVKFAYRTANNVWGSDYGGEESDTGYFDQQTSAWYVLTLCAIKLNCKMWFTDGKLYLIDTSLTWDELWNGGSGINTNLNSEPREAIDIHNLYLNMNDVYPLAPSQSEVNFSKAICGEILLGNEGAETICNMVQVTFNPYLDNRNAEKLGEIGLKKGVTGTGIVGNDTDGYEFDPDDLIKQSINVFGKKTQKLSLPELSLSDAQDIANKYAAAYCDSEQSIGFTMRELHYIPQEGGNVKRLWQRYFPQITRVDDIYDYSHDLVDKNTSNYQYNDGTSTGYHKMRNKLCLSTYEHHFPEGTTEYWFGIVKPTDITQNTSEIMNAVYKQ